MVEKTILKMKIKRAGGDFSVVMSRKAKSKDVIAILNYAAKKANAEQRKLVMTR